MKVKGYISLGLVGCDRQVEVEIDDSELEDMSEEERNAYLDEYLKDELFQYLEWGYDIVEK